MSITACAGRHALCRREGFRKFRPFGHCRNAAKAGIIGFTKALAKGVGRYGIRANVVAPGLIDTDMTAVLTEKARARLLDAVSMRRFGTAEEVAEAVAFLVSDRAAYVTGSVLEVHGGISL